MDQLKKSPTVELEERLTFNLTLNQTAGMSCINTFQVMTRGKVHLIRDIMKETILIMVRYFQTVNCNTISNKAVAIVISRHSSNL